MQPLQGEKRQRLSAEALYQHASLSFSNELFFVSIGPILAQPQTFFWSKFTGGHHCRPCLNIKVRVTVRNREDGACIRPLHQTGHTGGWGLC